MNISQSLPNQPTIEQLTETASRSVQKQFQLRPNVAIIIKVGGFVKKAVPMGDKFAIDRNGQQCYTSFATTHLQAHQGQHFNAVVVTGPGAVETTGKFNSKKGA
jgi:hypothetical protein